VKKQTVLALFIVTTFLPINCSEKSSKRLLFPFPDKSMDDLWQWVREDYRTYSFCSALSLPEDIQKRITYFLMALNNISSCFSFQDHFFQKLLRSCIVLNYTEKERKFPHNVQLSNDKCFYIEHLSGKVSVYNTATKKCIKTFENAVASFLKTKNVLFVQDNLYSSIPDLRNRAFFYDIENDKEYVLAHFSINSRVCLSSNEKYICMEDKIWNIADLDKIICCGQVQNCAPERMSFSSDEKQMAFFSGEQNLLFLVEIKNNQLNELARLHIKIKKEDRHGNVSFLGDDNCLSLCIFNSPGCCFYMSIAINKYSNGDIDLKEFFVQDHKYKRTSFSKNILAYVSDEEKCLFFADILRREIIYQEALENSFSGFIKMSNNKRLLYYCAPQNPLIQGILHLSYDQNEKITVTNKTSINDQRIGGYPAFFNSQDNLLIRTFERGVGHSVYTLDGTKVINCTHAKIDGCYQCNFTPSGNAALYGNKKYRLYPKGTDDFLKKLAHKPLTLAQYISLEKICDEGEKYREKKLIGISD
jgi:hypothetical protein